MADKKLTRKQAIRRRNTFLALAAILAAALLALIVFAVAKAAGKKEEGGNDSTPDISSSKLVDSSSNQSDNSSDDTSSDTPSDTSSNPSSQTTSSKPSSKTLDANYSRLLLVNGSHPLPDNFDYTGNLTTIPDKYINGSLKQIDKEVYPYLEAMIEQAWKDGVKLYVWSPYRSYNTQKMLFENQVKREKEKNGLSGKAAEDAAATVVARPGTSEHHTGLAIDFNMASDRFETTDMYKWMQKNAADYGFIMRYTKDKQPITGVIHESWHYRFVGINVAKEINSLGMCLEEYLEYKQDN